jgi:uncharacterized protein Yka (UPF0111/DUF47 family)
MNKDNTQKRVYMRPSKPVSQMNEGEIETFADQMYQKIMKTLFQQEEKAHEQKGDPNL